MRRHTEKNTWQIQEAKARFSQVINYATDKGHQTITKNGEPVAIILSQKEYDRLTKSKKNLLDVFKSSPFPEIDLEIPKRKIDQPRDLDL